ncbi:MAG: hypothetical protein FWF41_02940 [Betaproteobacteria bacterium]|nr:hypothetical protein [Betaproteobacteria bacterium]
MRTLVMVVIMATGMVAASVTVAAAETAASAKAISWQRELPKRARVIETVKVPSKHGQRCLVLWVADPKEYREESYGDPLTCPEMAKGKHYIDGLVRLSLVDERRSRIINTVPIENERYIAYLFDNPADGNKKTLAIDVPDPENRKQSIPLDVTQTLYEVSRGKDKGKGRVMRMRDINGDGLPNEFAFYTSESCSDIYAAVAGYSERTDKAILYNFHLQVNDEGKISTEDIHWVPAAFDNASQWLEHIPPDKGVWRFTWRYPEEVPREYRYEIRYDAAREAFVGTETIVRVP